MRGGRFQKTHHNKQQARCCSTPVRSQRAELSSLTSNSSILQIKHSFPQQCQTPGLPSTAANRGSIFHAGEKQKRPRMNPDIIQSINTALVAHMHDDKATTKLTVSLPMGTHTLNITLLWLNSEFNRGKSGQEVQKHCPSLQDAEARGKAPADLHGRSQRKLNASNTRQDEEAQLGREQTDELAGKRAQPSINKPLSSGLQPSPPAGL